MLSRVDDFFEFPHIRVHVAGILNELSSRLEADASLLAVPDAQPYVFRVWPAVDQDMPFGETNLLVSNSNPCTAVIETKEIVSIRDVSKLSAKDSCSFMVAEEFAGYLGAPVTIGERPAAILAVVSYEPNSWTDTHRAYLSATCERLSEILSGGVDVSIARH